MFGLVEVVAEYFVCYFSFLLDTVECFYRTVEIIEIPNKWLVVLYHFRQQLFPSQVFNRISWFRLPSLLLTSQIHPVPDILSILECWHEIIGNKMCTKRKRERLSFGTISQGSSPNGKTNEYFGSNLIGNVSECMHTCFCLPLICEEEIVRCFDELVRRTTQCSSRLKCREFSFVVPS